MATTTHPFFDHPGPLPLAHQGGGAEEVENSARAFAHAAALGYRYLDVDLQATADEVLVAHHDETLERLTGLPGAMEDYTWRELADARLPNGEPLVRFEELLEAHPYARWNIEIKNEAASGPTVDLVRARGLADRVCLGAISDLRMFRIRRSASGIRPAYAAPLGATLWLKLTSRVPLPFVGPADATLAPVRDRGVPILDQRFVDRAHRAGVLVIAWTIDKPDEMHRLIDVGVDGILTDAPTVLRSVLTDRGVWV